MRINFNLLDVLLHVVLFRRTVGTVKFDTNDDPDGYIYCRKSDRVTHARSGEEVALHVEAVCVPFTLENRHEALHPNRRTMMQIHSQALLAGYNIINIELGNKTYTPFDGIQFNPSHEPLSI